MGQYRKKPVVIEAVQFDGIEQVDGTPTAMFEGSFDDLPEWLIDAMAKPDSAPGAVFVFGDGLTVVTLEGPHRADPEDWIIRGVAGELYPCKPEIFAATYDLADAPHALPEDVEERIATLEHERDEAIKRADAAEAADKKSTAAVKKLTTPAKPRRLGEMDESKALSGPELVGAIASADTVEIVFSDGKREVPGLAPIGVSGAAWKPHAFGVMLGKPVELEGPDGNASVSIAGYALLLDGKQVAWRERDMPLQVAPRQRVSITDDILF